MGLGGVEQEQTIRSKLCGTKIAAVAITATVLGLAAPASAQMYGGGWWGGPHRHYYNYYPRRHLYNFAPRHHTYRSWWGGY